MIPLWVARDAPTPLREQLGAQLLLGILSGSICPGERLPSVRSLARRFQIHPNTVSKAYRELAERGWVDARRGSGVYVKAAAATQADIDTLACGYLREATAHGFTVEELISALGRMSEDARARPMLVIDPDAELARIMAAEIQQVRSGPVDSTGLDLSELTRKLTRDAIPLVSIRHTARLTPLLKGRPYRTIRISPIAEMLRGLRPPAPESLIAIVSRSGVLFQWAQSLLPALGIAPDAILFRSPADRNWTAGLSSCGLIAADAISGAELPNHLRYFALRLVSAASIAELRSNSSPAIAEETGELFSR